MPSAPAAGTAGTAPASAGGPLGEGTLNLSSSSPPAGSSAFTATPAPTNKAVLSSSAPARAATAANVTKLQTITAPAPASLQPAVDKINKGVTNYNANPSGTTPATPSTPPTPPTPPTPSTPAAGGTGTSTGAAVTSTGSTATPDASKAGTPGYDSQGNPTNYDAAVATIADPGLREQYKGVLQALDASASDAYNTIASLKTASASTDPATMATVDAIMAKYTQQIQIMQDKNAQVLGRAKTSVAAFGGLGNMSQTFLNDEQQRAQDRVTALQNEEQSLILQAQAAFQTNDTKALNDAITRYDTINKQKMDELNTLLTETNKQVTQQQAQQRLDQQAQKDQLASDVTTSTKIAAGVAANLAAAGVTVPEQVKKYIAQVAQQYGITNPDLLYSQVVSAQNLNAKNDLSAKNIQSEITTREQNAATAADRAATAAEKAAAAAANPKQTVAEKKAAAIDDVNAGMVPGATIPGTAGTPILDENGDLTADAFNHLLTNPPPGLTRKDVVSTWGPALVKGGTISSNYKLTPVEIRSLTGSLTGTQ